MSEVIQKPRTARAVGVVQEVRSVTPMMQRITVSGDEITDFLTVEGVAEPAAWVKVFLPSGEGRAYTIRHMDHEAGSIDLDFVLHGTNADSGPASAWAAQASVGEHLGIAGPRSGGFSLPHDAEWVLIAGDTTALPGMQSIAAQLPPDIDTKIFVEVANKAEQQAIPSPAIVRTHWVTALSEPCQALCKTLLSQSLPSGPGYIWIAGESTAIRTLRLHYLQDLALPKHRVSAKGYWKAGEGDHKDS